MCVNYLFLCICLCAYVNLRAPHASALNVQRLTDALELVTGSSELPGMGAGTESGHSERAGSSHNLLTKEPPLLPIFPVVASFNFKNFTESI